MSKNRGTGMKKLWMGVCILTLAALACNINAAPTSPPAQSALATIVAQTMQVVMSETTSPPPLNTPVNTPFEASTPSATQTAVKAILTINQNTNCRSGPSADSNIITAFTPGTTLEIVGKDSADDFWLVKLPNTEDTCWASGQYATPSGGYASLPEVTPTASTAQGVPTKPGSLFYQYSCSFGNLTTQLTWADTSDNETGFHVYRNDALIATLPANSTSYTDTTTIPAGSTITYGVTAFNNVGESAARTQSFQCK
jgi:Bacterial SH3 domain